MVNNSSATSWVVKALVEATPISGPASVIRYRSELRTREESGTLQMASVARKGNSAACSRAPRVSVVSPDWDRSEERRVGKEGRARASPRHSKRDSAGEQREGA